MSFFDYMNFVSEYIIKKIENKDEYEYVVININTLINPVTSNITYEIKELLNYVDNGFYLKFPCNSKTEFYSATCNIIEYFKNSPLFSYSIICKSNMFFSIITKNRVNISFNLNEEDLLVFEDFKNYLDGNYKDSNMNAKTYRKI